MDLLNYHVNQKQFNTAKEFVEEFDININDVVFITKAVFEDYFKELNLNTNYFYSSDYLKGEPDNEVANKLINDINSKNPKRLFAIGGGSVIDLAKVCAVSNGQNVDEIFDNKDNLKKQYELIIVPVTCGTGSEVSNVSVINRLNLGTKMGLASPALFADYAVLIPELLNNLPFKVFATSSLDALVHAVESALSPFSTSHSELFSYEAIKLIIDGYKYIAKNGIEKRNDKIKEFLIASNYAGLAFTTAGTATVHAMAYPFGGNCHVAHGESNYTLFTGVLKYYLNHCNSDKLDKMLNFLSLELECGKNESLDKLEELCNHILKKKALKDYGAKYEDLPNWAKSCHENQQRLLSKSPIEMSEEAILEIYQNLY